MEVCKQGKESQVRRPLTIDELKYSIRTHKETVRRKKTISIYSCERSLSHLMPFPLTVVLKYLRE